MLSKKTSDSRLYFYVQLEAKQKGMELKMIEIENMDIEKEIDNKIKAYYSTIPLVYIYDYKQVNGKVYECHRWTDKNYFEPYINDLSSDEVILQIGAFEQKLKELNKEREELDLKDDISEEKFKVLIDDAKESIEIRKKLLKERNINVTDKLIRETYTRKLFNDLYGALEERRRSLIENVNYYEEKSDELDEICDFYDGSLSFPNWLEEKERDMRDDLNDARKQLERVNSQIQYVLKKR